VRCSRAQTARDQRQQRNLGRQLVQRSIRKSVTQQRSHCLHVYIYPVVLTSKAQRARRTQHLRRRQFAEQIVREQNAQVPVAALYRMADLVALRRVEKQDVVCVADRLFAADMTHIHTAVGKDQMRG
jgi:phosphohistidine phosphatase SixA